MGPARDSATKGLTASDGWLHNEREETMQPPDGSGKESDPLILATVIAHQLRGPVASAANLIRLVLALLC